MGISLHYAKVNKVKYADCSYFKNEQMAIKDFLYDNLDVPYSYMESNEFELPKEDLELLLKKLRTELRATYSNEESQICISGALSDYTYSEVIQFLEDVLVNAEGSDEDYPYIRFAWF